MMEVSLIQTTGEEEVRLEIPATIALVDGGLLGFKSMAELVEFSDVLAGHASGWKADQAFGALTGLRKLIADAIVASMREQIAQACLTASPGDGAKLRAYSRQMAEFPNDVLIGGQWAIDIQKLDDRPFIEMTVATHVKALIVSIADSFAMAREASER